MHWLQSSRQRTECAKRQLTLVLHQSKAKKTKMDYFTRRRTTKFPGCVNARLRMPRKGSEIWRGDIASKADFERAIAVMEWLEARKMFMKVHLREDHEANRYTKQFLKGKMTFPEYIRQTESGIGPVTLGFRTQEDMFEFKMRWY